MGGDLGETVPPKIWGGGTAHASVPPIFWAVVFVGSVQKHEQSKKGVIKELFYEIGVFLARKWSYMTLHQQKIRKILNGRWLKKGHQKFGAWKWKCFPIKRHSEILVCNIFSRPPKLGARSPPMVPEMPCLVLLQKMSLTTLPPVTCFCAGFFMFRHAIHGSVTITIIIFCNRFKIPEIPFNLKPLINTGQHSDNVDYLQLRCTVVYGRSNTRRIFEPCSFPFSNFFPCIAKDLKEYFVDAPIRLRQFVVEQGRVLKKIIVIVISWQTFIERTNRWHLFHHFLFFRFPF